MCQEAITEYQKADSLRMAAVMVASWQQNLTLKVYVGIYDVWRICTVVIELPSV